MAKQCPECRTRLDDSAFRCGVCGCQMVKDMPPRWEQTKLFYVVIAAAVLAIVLYFFLRH